MSNNFQVAGPVKQEHPLYRGRTRLVEELLMVCSKPCQYYTIIHGNFRMGKTSLLRHFEHRLEQTDFIKSVLIDLRSQVHANLEQVYGYVAKHIVQKLSTHRFEQKSVRSCDDLARMLSEIMNQSLESCHLALILENLVVLTPPLRAELANTLNWMFNNRWDFPGLERVSIILTGGIEFYKLYIPGLSPLSQSCRAHFLDDFSEADAVNLIQAGLVDFVSLEEEERARLGGWVYEYAHGHPALTQLMGYEIYIQLAQGKTFGLDLVKRAAKAVIYERNFFWELNNQLEAHQLMEEAKNLKAMRIPYQHQSESISQKLAMLGVVKSDHDGYCEIRNKLMGEAIFSP